MRIPPRLPIIEGDIARVPLTHGYEAVIDAIDANDVGRHNWCVAIENNNRYAVTNIRDGNRVRKVRLHRFIMRPPADAEIDHEDQNGLNCRRINLRIATKSQNQFNRSKAAHNKSGYKGVDLWYGKWRAQISANGVRKTIGLFDDPEQAHAAYCEEAVKLHGQFARTS